MFRKFRCFKTNKKLLLLLIIYMSEGKTARTKNNFQNNIRTFKFAWKSLCIEMYLCEIRYFKYLHDDCKYLKSC